MASLKVFGNQSVNYIWITKTSIDENIISECTSSNNKPSWDSNTVFLSRFVDNIHGSNFSGDGGEIVGYSIYRKDRNNILSFVANVDEWVKSIDDFLAINNETYTYYVFPLTISDGKQVSLSPITTIEVTPKWDCVSIIGIKKAKNYKNVYLVEHPEDNIWNFRLNIEYGDIEPNMEKIVQKTSSVFPKVTRSKMNYTTGSISCLIGDVSYNGVYTDSIDLVKKWETFINDGKIKLLKDTKGNILPIEIVSSTFSYDNNSIDQPITLSLSYVQLMNAEDISVYGV